MSGNLSFLNWLTIVPSLACFDDASLGFLFGARGGARKAVVDLQHEDAAGHTPKPTKGVPCSSSSCGSSIFHLLPYTLTDLTEQMTVMCLFNSCRDADAPRGERVSGRPDWIPEHSRGDEPAQLQAADEHLLRPAAHRQHLRGLWKVRRRAQGRPCLPPPPPRQRLASDPCV